MSAREFAEWRAYYRLEPWGETRADARAAQTGMWLAALAGSKGRRLKDFLAGRLVPAVEALEQAETAPTGGDAATEAASRKAAAGVLRAALAGVKVRPKAVAKPRKAR